jgi:glycosyltransferase involved in cell wall biosynthesis
MDAHDLFVMPSRLEGFGMVFVEALARGLPCIGRRAFAMPELIDDGVTGAIVDSLDPKDVAEAIRRTLASDEIYAEVEGQADQVATRFSWDQTAARVIKIIGDSISSV